MNPIYKLYQQFNLADHPFVYVDCGARGEKKNKFVELFAGSRYIGFEPDERSFGELQARQNDTYRYYNAALWKSSRECRLYCTRNPSCSSLLKPNREMMDKFIECGPFFEVLSEETVATTPLDFYLQAGEISHVDVLELDTQGSELDILRGAESYLKTSVLAIKTEVEFNEMYLNQPLFGAVDAYIRQFDFGLFDLSRYRLIRKSIDLSLQTRGQLMWGHAIYLKDYNVLEENPTDLLKLAIIASFYNFHDYALEILGHMLTNKGGDQALNRIDIIEQSISAYRQYLEKGHSHNSNRNRSLIRNVISAVKKAIKDHYRHDSSSGKYFIKD